MGGILAHEKGNARVKIRLWGQARSLQQKGGIPSSSGVDDLLLNRGMLGGKRERKGLYRGKKCPDSHRGIESRPKLGFRNEKEKNGETTGDSNSRLHKGNSEWIAHLLSHANESASEKKRIEKKSVGRNSASCLGKRKEKSMKILSLSGRESFE